MITDRARVIMKKSDISDYVVDFTSFTRRDVFDTFNLDPSYVRREEELFNRVIEQYLLQN